MGESRSRSGRMLKISHKNLIARATWRLEEIRAPPYRESAATKTVVTECFESHPQINFLLNIILLHLLHCNVSVGKCTPFIRLCLALVAEMLKTANGSEGDGSHEPFLSRPPAGRSLSYSGHWLLLDEDPLLHTFYSVPRCLVAVESEYSHDHVPLHLLSYPLDAARLHIHI
jgi:hypothetical protein